MSGVEAPSPIAESIQHGKEDVNSIKHLKGTKRRKTFLDTSAVIQEFVDVIYSREHYTALAERAQSLVEAALKGVRDQDNVEVQFKSTCRAKEASSLEQKLKVRNQTREYQNARDILEDVKDLAGVRIVLYTPNEAQRLRVKQAIQDIWGVDRIEEVPHGDPKLAQASTLKMKHDRDKGKMDEYIPKHLGYQAEHYRTPMLESQRSKGYEWKPFDKVEIQVVSALGHAWAEASHDVMYKTHAYGKPTLMEKRVLDALNGLIVSGDLLLEQFRDAVTKRTYAVWKHEDELATFLRETDVLNAEGLSDENSTRTSSGNHFSREANNLLYRFLVATNQNYPLAVRETLTALGYPDDPELGLEKELARFDSEFRPPHGLRAPFCVLSYMSPKTPIDVAELDMAKKCSVMMDAFILLQAFSKTPQAAKDYLLDKVAFDKDEKDSLEFVLNDPHRRDCYMRAEGDLKYNLEQELEAGWTWFAKQANLDKPCGLFFRLALMGLPFKEMAFPKRMEVLNIKSLSRSNTEVA